MKKIIITILRKRTIIFLRKIKEYTKCMLPFLPDLNEKKINNMPYNELKETYKNLKKITKKLNNFKQISLFSKFKKYIFAFIICIAIVIIVRLQQEVKFGVEKVIPINKIQMENEIVDFENKTKAEQQEYFSKNGEYKTIEETTEGNIKYRVDRYISWLGGEVVGVGYQIYTEKDGFKKSTGEGHLKETLDYDFKEIQIIKPEIREYIATTTK